MTEIFLAERLCLNCNNRIKQMSKTSPKAIHKCKLDNAYIDNRTAACSKWKISKHIKKFANAKDKQYALLKCDEQVGSMHITRYVKQSDGTVLRITRDNKL